MNQKHYISKLNTFTAQSKYVPPGRYSISSNALLYRTNISLTACLTPVSHPLSFSPPPPQYIFQTELSYSSVSLCSHKLGMGVLPQCLSARLRRQPLALKIFPIMQTDKGMLFKSPQPICWSLFIYKGLQAASPVKTILDTYAHSLARSLLCFPPPRL